MQQLTTCLAIWNYLNGKNLLLLCRRALRPTELQWVLWRYSGWNLKLWSSESVRLSGGTAAGSWSFVVHRLWGFSGDIAAGTWSSGAHKVWGFSGGITAGTWSIVVHRLWGFSVNTPKPTGCSSYCAHKPVSVNHVWKYLRQINFWRWWQDLTTVLHNRALPDGGQ